MPCKFTLRHVHTPGVDASLVFVGKGEGVLPEHALRTIPINTIGAARIPDSKVSGLVAVCYVRVVASSRRLTPALCRSAALSAAYA
jgi:hypothetical protein